MARLRGPDMGSRFVLFPNGNPAVGRKGTVYLSPGGPLADIGEDDGTETVGAPILDSEVTVDQYGLLPTFWFPDGVDRLYISVNGGPITPIDADYNPRIDTKAQTVNVQQFTTPGASTWTKPEGARLIEVITIGGGGGGGSGRRGAALTVRTGGGGGGGGGVTRGLLNAADLPNSCPLVVGLGALGGSSVSVADNSNGLGGGSGGHSVFNDTVQSASNASRVRAGGGAPGLGGNTGLAAGGNGGFALFGGAAGGASHSTGLVGSNGGDGGGGVGGGGGGGITAADVASNGGVGGVNSTLDQNRAFGGVAPGGIGEQGRGTLSMGPGNGAAGGAASITGAAGAGGVGGTYGGGGGGGGASLNGFSVGAGGKGGDGAVFVITYF